MTSAFGRRPLRLRPARWHGVLGALLAALLATWFLRRVDFVAVAGVLRRVHVGWVAAAALLQLAALATRGWRWRTMLLVRAPVPLGAALAATFMGWVALVLVPARLGELARPWLLDRRHRFDRSFALGAQQLERLLDLLVLIGMLALYLVAGPPPVLVGRGAELQQALERGEHLLFAFAVAALAGMVAVVALAPQLERKLAARLGERWQRWRSGRLSSRLLAFLHGLTALRTSHHALAAAAQSLLLWLFVAATHVCLIRAFELDLPLLAVPPLLAFVVLGALIPVPAGIGSYHKAVQGALVSLLGVPLAAATGYALVGHAVAYLPNLLVGSTLLLAEGISSTELGAGGAVAPRRGSTGD